jgi:hypothetical protein
VFDPSKPLDENQTRVYSLALSVLKLALPSTARIDLVALLEALFVDGSVAPPITCGFSDDYDIHVAQSCVKIPPSADEAPPWERPLDAGGFQRQLLALTTRHAQPEAPLREVEISRPLDRATVGGAGGGLTRGAERGEVRRVDEAGSGC